MVKEDNTLGTRVLVVEDDRDILTILKDQLELDGFEVEGVTTGRGALKAFELFNPHAVILDLNLPDTDGLKVCKAIRSKDSEVSILMLTARDRLCDKVRGFETGCDDYVVKPFEYLELKARLKAVLRRRLTGTVIRDELVFGPLKIFPQKREVWWKDKLVKLTKKEYDLLEILASHPNQVMKREFIVGQLWSNKEVYSWSRALDVHVLRLRQKLEPHPDSPQMIITHPGVGYRFCPPA